MKAIPLFPPSQLDADLKEIWRQYFITFRGLSLLPPGMAYRLVQRVAREKYRREQSWVEKMIAGVSLAYPDAPASFATEMVKAHYDMAAREILDVFYLSRLRQRHLGRTLIPCGFDTLSKTQPGRGTIIAMGHYGRPIMLSTALGLSGFKIGMLSQAVDARNSGLNPVMQIYLQYKMERTISQAGGTWLTTLDSPRLLYAAMERGESIIIMLDVPKVDAKKRIEAEFLGGTLSVPVGILRLLQKTGARLVYGVTIDHGRVVGAEIRSLPEKPEQAMAAAIQELHKDVRANPWQWWQWGQLDLLWKPHG